MEKKKIRIPKCDLTQRVGHPRQQLYSVDFEDGLSGELFVRDGYYQPEVSVYNEECLPLCRSIDEAIVTLYERLALMRDHPEEAEALKKATIYRKEALKNALDEASLFKFDKKAKIAVYRAQDIDYEVIPWGASGVSDKKSVSTHLPLFEIKKYFFKAEDGVHAFTPLESFYGFHLLLKDGLEYDEVKVATRCTIDGIDGDCLIVADYAQSAAADRLDNMSPYDDFVGISCIWTESPCFHQTEEDAANERNYWSPKLRRMSAGNDRIVYSD